jgi:pimeloyl-ACP methyl ester carboxylesterase
VNASAAFAAVGGMAVLLGTAGLLVSALYFAGLWRDALRPERRTMGWALARGFPSHPDDLGAASELRTVRCGGTDVPAWFVTGGDPSSNHAVVILHGHGRSRWDSLRRAAAWLPRAALVVLPDLRGHGECTGRSSLGRREAADVAALVAEIERAHPGIRITLAGHSMGAVVAIRTAALREAAGTPLAGVVAWGPYETTRIPLEARLAARGVPRAPFSTIALRIIDALDGPDEPLSAAARRLTHTPLAVHADATDAISPPAGARAIAQAAPHGTFTESHGTAHADLGLPGA